MQCALMGTDRERLIHVSLPDSPPCPKQNYHSTSSPGCAGMLPGRPIIRRTVSAASSGLLAAMGTMPHPARPSGCWPVKPERRVRASRLQPQAQSAQDDALYTARRTVSTKGQTCLSPRNEQQACPPCTEPFLFEMPCDPAYGLAAADGCGLQALAATEHVAASPSEQCSP